MKKNRIEFLLFCAGLFLALSGLRAGGVANVDVTVSDATGRLTYRGKTDASGVFVTPPIRPGNYVVQFQAKKAAANRNDYAIYAASGHQRIVADAVPGQKFAGAGVAVRVKPTTSSAIIAQVAVGGLNELGTKIVNGVRYVLLPPETGEIGPRWVEEGTQPARNVTRIQIEDGSLIKANVLGSAH
jgi:hypothetical protein